jgi:hypothetical protein
VVRDLPVGLPAQTQVIVRFQYEQNGRLTVRVRVAGTKTDLRHEIRRENSLDKGELDHWRKRISGLPPLECGSSEGSQTTRLMESGSPGTD